jgi:hypothetical protein
MRSPLFALVSLALLTACESKKPAEAVPFEEICDAKHDSKMEKGLDVKKRVSVEGYLDIPRGMFTMCSDTCSMQLLPEPKAVGKGLSVSFKIGTDDAQMKKLPDKYTETDLEVRAEGGKTVGAGDKVRVTGERLGSAAEKSCQIVNVDKVEKL